MVGGIHAANPDKGTGKFAIAAVLIGKQGGAVGLSYRMKGLIVWRPEKPRRLAVNRQPQIHRPLDASHRSQMIFPLQTVIDMNDIKARAPQPIVKGFVQEQIVHIVVVQHHPGAVLEHLGLKIHACGQRGVHRGQLPRQQTDAVLRTQRLLTA